MKAICCAAMVCLMTLGVVATVIGPEVVIHNLPLQPERQTGSERHEEVGKDGPQRATQPDIKEIGQVCVADVVVVGRVC